MKKTALFVRHKAKPGRREDLQGVWEKYVKPRVESNPAHEAYYFCHDADDPDVVCVFQLYSSREDLDAFLSGDWYPQYLEEVSELVIDAPEIRTADPIWIK